MAAFSFKLGWKRYCPRRANRDPRTAPQDPGAYGGRSSAPALISGHQHTEHLGDSPARPSIESVTEELSNKRAPLRASPLGMHERLGKLPTKIVFRIRKDYRSALDYRSVVIELVVTAEINLFSRDVPGIVGHIDNGLVEHAKLQRDGRGDVDPYRGVPEHIGQQVSILELWR